VQWCESRKSATVQEKKKNSCRKNWQKMSKKIPKVVQKLSTISSHLVKKSTGVIVEKVQWCIRKLKKGKRGKKIQKFVKKL
jgi:hypothetical protein